MLDRSLARLAPSLLIFVGALVGGGCEPEAEPEPETWEWTLPYDFPAPAVPEENPMSAAKVELGRHLFYDKRLSGNGTFSCGSCHDQAKGFADGMPPLPSRTARDAWAQTLGTNFRRLRRRGSDGLVRMYGATSPAEYFAVTSEVFFSRPDDLHDRLPRVYDRLAEFYRQDPALR